ncbi:orotate phosphoribosyltransferase [Ruminiclostridium hungatei]|uniref:Orotate phosphoribosyltransferase n=1 Tax=Ruminiclostridium hungatei TaxID=48256 RepID=A0A1V4SRY6_RUMHU|nr:orotate phosphoribosyltransferase [Ruminiclostridium hungatei]OPX45997.1 orotate phosphoribosyltransferase [Ruminiclostridium hungatei]
MDKNILAKEIYNISHLTGTFKLRSGQISREYFDKYLFESNPQVLISIVEYMSKLIPQNTEVLAGLEMGGIPIATALSIKTGIPAVFVRKKAKDYGTCKLAEGMDISGKNVCIIEDVVTTGGQIILSADDLKKFNAKVNNVLCVILRNEEGRDKLRNAGLHLMELFTMSDLNPNKL